MRTLTNDYHDFQLLNLGLNPGGRGPYAVRQTGMPPASDTFQEDAFLLRRDGTWVINFSVFTLSEEDQKEFFYPDVPILKELVERLPPKPVVHADLPPDSTREQLLQAFDRTQSRVLQAIREARGSSIT